MAKVEREIVVSTSMAARMVGMEEEAMLRLLRVSQWARLAPDRMGALRSSRTVALRRPPPGEGARP